MIGKSFGDRYQQRSGGIRARAVSQNQRVAVRIRGRVQKTTDSGVQRIIAEFRK